MRIINQEIIYINPQKVSSIIILLTFLIIYSISIVPGGLEVRS